MIYLSKAFHQVWREESRCSSLLINMHWLTWHWFKLFPDHRENPDTCEPARDWFPKVWEPKWTGRGSQSGLQFTSPSLGGWSSGGQARAGSSSHQVVYRWVIRQGRHSWVVKQKYWWLRLEQAPQRPRGGPSRANGGHLWYVLVTNLRNTFNFMCQFG